VKWTALKEQKRPKSVSAGDSGSLCTLQNAEKEKKVGALYYPLESPTRKGAREKGEPRIKRGGRGAGAHLLLIKTRKH